MFSGAVVGAAFLARRNFKQGRSDRKGALRLAMAVIVAMQVGWIIVDVQLRTLEIGTLFSEIVLGRAMGHALLHAMLVWLAYMALEPYVRRLWPESLVSWTRVLLGRFRDPLVGRDLLVGMALWTAWLCLIGLLDQGIRKWAGVPIPDLMRNVQALTLRDGIAGLLGQAQAAVGMPMVALVVLVLMRMLFRRTWLAILVPTLLIVLVGITGAKDLSVWMHLWQTFAALGTIALWLFCVFRVGVLSAIGGTFAFATMNNAPLTWDTSQWYAGTSLLVLAAIAALAIWSFYVSLAGRQLFRDSLLDDA
jgi:serine/threonine-protein kinase